MFDPAATHPHHHKAPKPPTQHPPPHHHQNFLELNLPKVKKSGKFALGVIEPALGTVIQEELSFPCKSDEATREVIRGIRLHFNKYVRWLVVWGWYRGGLGLSKCGRLLACVGVPRLAFGLSHAWP